MTTKIGRVYLLMLCIYALTGAADSADIDLQSHAYFKASLSSICVCLFLATGLWQVVKIIQVVWHELGEE